MNRSLKAPFSGLKTWASTKLEFIFSSVHSSAIQEIGSEETSFSCPNFKESSHEGKGDNREVRSEGKQAFLERTFTRKAVNHDSDAGSKGRLFHFHKYSE